MKKKEAVFLGIDLGGTNIGTAAVRDGKVLAHHKTKTQANKGPRVVIERIEKTVHKVAQKLNCLPGDFQALCVGAPGAVELETGMVNDAPNLDWIDVPLGDTLEKKLGIPVFVDNDVNAGVIGEYVHGAGRGFEHMVGVFVGTGIGGGVIINGEMHYGGRGSAGEIGHMVIVPGGRTCSCGKKGCVEAYTSKTAIAAAIREQIDLGRDSYLKETLANNKDKPLSSSLIEDALKSRDPVTTEAVQQAQFYLGLLTANLVNTLDPDVIVFGGGLVEQLGDDFLEPIRQTAKTHYLQQKDAGQIQIIPAALGDQAGTIGAAVVAQQRLESK
jgi:glucokinase